MRKNQSVVITRGLRVFRMSYGSGETAGVAARWYIELRWAGRSNRFPAFTDKSASIDLARGIHRLAMRRENAQPLDDDGRRLVEAMASTLRVKLVELGIIDPMGLASGESLDSHVTDWGKALKSKGNTVEYVASRLARVRRVFTACGFAMWSDLNRPGVGTAIISYLAELREGKTDEAKPSTEAKVAPRRITGQSVNYYISALKGFARWMVADKRAAESPQAQLAGVGDVDSDRKRERRALTEDELGRLLRATETAPFRFGLSGADRARLYRFAFETGMRPKQIRGLTVASFQLDANPPTVTAAAKSVKRRERHTQPLSASMTADLKTAMANKLPAAVAFDLPGEGRMVKMFRADLATARDTWLDEAGDDAGERMKRLRSDFLAAVDHHQQHATFYSLRHTTGSVMADRGVSQNAIKTVLHHTRTATTDRYVHTSSAGLRSAIASLPDFSNQSQLMAATGTDDTAPLTAPMPILCAKLGAFRGHDPENLDGSGQSEETSDEPPNAKTPEKSGVSGVKTVWAEPGSNRRHMDFQSIALPAELSARGVDHLRVTPDDFKLSFLRSLLRGFYADGFVVAAAMDHQDDRIVFVGFAEILVGGFETFQVGDGLAVDLRDHVAGMELGAGG